GSREPDPSSNFDYNYGGPVQEGHEVSFTNTPASTRLFVESYSPEFYPRLYINSIKWGAHPYEFGERKRNITDPVVQIKNPLIDGGLLIPGFNETYRGKAPDLGAFEVDAPPLEFGRRAYYRHDEGLAPWEKF